MDEKKKLLGIYDYTVVLTYFGMLMGFMGIIFVLNAQYQHAIFCLMLAGVCDMFDGTVAATKQRNQYEKHFGIQIDSLSDLICFGVLPALFVYQIDPKTYISFGITGLYVLCALIRLAWFNVSEEKREQSETTARKEYQGLPVTTAALLLPAIFLLYQKSKIVSPASFLILLFLMACLFLCPIKVKKPHMILKIGIVITGLIELLLLIFSGLGAT